MYQQPFYSECKPLASCDTEEAERGKGGSVSPGPLGVGGAASMHPPHPKTMYSVRRQTDVLHSWSAQKRVTLQFTCHESMRPPDSAPPNPPSVQGIHLFWTPLTPGSLQTRDKRGFLDAPCEVPLRRDLGHPALSSHSQT